MLYYRGNGVHLIEEEMRHDLDENDAEVAAPREQEQRLGFRVWVLAFSVQGLGFVLYYRVYVLIKNNQQ